jgi:hypothetical protein
MLLTALLGLAAAGCAVPASEAPHVEVAPAGNPPVATAPGAAVGEQGEVGAIGALDYRCRTDADCTVKDVGNCCGYYPACVNSTSPTFADQVRADCAREGTASVCGFPVIDRCQCVASRCEAASGDAAALPLD